MPELELNADLVLEGGGVKGIALAGAYSVIEERGYTIKRVAGTSAGSIVGALIAAGFTAKQLEDEMRKLDYLRFKDKSFFDKLPFLGKAMSVLFEDGIYEGEYAKNWVRDQLASKGIGTFADLPYENPELKPEQKYRLVVMVSDITSGSLCKLPWDYPEYKLEPGTQKVADAVRASMSIPFFFEPVKLGRSVLVDGGMLSNFPVQVFDAPKEREPRWPTFGIKLSTRAKALEGTIADVDGPIDMTIAMIKTMTSFYDRMYVDNPDVQARTIFVDTGTIRATDFDLKPAQRDMLFKNGRDAANKFFDGGDGQKPWDWKAYKREFRQPG
ncbi:MAG: patatin-like phospholipase family protein [Nocardioidaceae bacterium]